MGGVLSRLHPLSKKRPSVIINAVERWNSIDLRACDDKLSIMIG